MSDFFESAKQRVGQAINRAGWETQKRMRINKKQGELNHLKEEHEHVVESLASAVLLMYQQGQLTDPQLRKYCTRLVEMERETMLVSAQLEQIRAETYDAAQDPHLSLSALPGIPSINPFPSSPLAKTTPVSQPPGVGKAPAPQEAMTPCPTCGEPVRTKAMYCNKCGTKLR